MRLLTEVEASTASASSVFRCSYAPDGAIFPAGNPKNLYESFMVTADQHPNFPCLGHRHIEGGEAQDYVFSTYAQVKERIINTGSALKALNVSKGSAVGIYAANSPAWMVAMKSADFCGAQTVPLYDTFGPDAVEYIIKHSGLTVIFVSENLLKQLTEAGLLPKIRDQVVQIVVWSTKYGAEVDPQIIQNAEDSGIPITQMSKFEEFGKSNIQQPTPGDIKDLCTIMYTSGTTGEPKGVEITHEAILASVGALKRLVQEWGVTIGSDDSFLSYLPLAHIFGRVAEEMFLGMGGSIGYWQGSIKTLMDDVGALRPTIFVGVPRIFDRIYSTVTEKMKNSPWVTRSLYNTLFAVKDACVKMGFTKVPVVDDLAFKKVQQRIGGRVRVVVSGGAPLAPHVERFLKVALCCPVSQGYGLTETCGASFIQNPYAGEQAGTVGPPVAGVDLCLRSIPDMGYDATTDPPKGEVCMRGPAVFSGYHKQQEKTDEVLHDGWFSTGDVGMLCADGALKIIDRKKNFFKLSHGEYVAAEKLENTLKKNTFVDQIWVYGDSERAQLVAVVVPDETGIQEIASQVGVSGDLETLCNSTALADEVQKRLEEFGRAEGLKGFEIVKRVHMFAEGFSTDNDLMTPSFKLKRPQLKQRFEKIIKQMYSSLE